MRRVNRTIAFFLCLSFPISQAIACVPLSALEEGDHFGRFSRGIPGATEKELATNCARYVSMQNDLVRQGVYEGTTQPEYKHFWCLDEYGMEYNPISGTNLPSYYYGAIYNIGLEDLIINLMDKLILPALPDNLQAMANAGDPACQPDCDVGNGINPYSANFYYEHEVMSIDVVNFDLSYNSINQTWTSSFGKALREYITSTPDGPIKIQAVITGDGKAHPMVRSQDAYYCSPDGTRGGLDELSNEFTVEMSNRILKFLPDGRLKNVIIRDIDRSINLDYTIDGRVVVSTLGGEAGFSAELNENGRPTSVESLGSSNPVTASLNWDVNGNLLSTTVAGRTTNFLYLDPNNPNLLTGIAMGVGGKQARITYDENWRVVKKSVINEDGQIIDVATVDYSHVDDTDPFVRTKGQNGLVEDRYFQRFFGIYKTTKVVRHTAAGQQVVAQYAYNRLGHLIESVNADGLVTQYETDGFNRIKRIVEQGAGVSRETIIGWNKECEEPATITTVGEKRRIISYDSACRVTSNSVEDI